MFLTFMALGLSVDRKGSVGRMRPQAVIRRMEVVREASIRRITLRSSALHAIELSIMEDNNAALVGRATPDAAGKARPTVNVMNYEKLNSIANHKLRNIIWCLPVST